MNAQVYQWSIGATLAAVVGIQSAAAQSTFHVKEADIEKGGWVFETINAYQGRFTPRSDRIRNGHEIGLGYGVTDWWQPKVLISFDRPDDQSLELQRVLFENVFNVRALAEGKDGLGIAWFQSVEGAIHNDQTNATIFGPIISGQAGKFSFATNTFFEKTFGQNREQGVNFIYALQARYEIMDKVKLGFETYGHVPEIGGSNPANIGLQNRVGPVLIFEVDLPRGMVAGPGGGGHGSPAGRGLKTAGAAGHGAAAPHAEIEMGVLFGTTAYTPDVTGKVNMHIKF